MELRKLFNYTEQQELRQEFIDDVEVKITDDYEVFNRFMSKVLALITVEPTIGSFIGRPILFINKSFL
jgi:hypothetical protein